jgi:hypothetical protein
MIRLIFQFVLLMALVAILVHNGVPFKPIIACIGLFFVNGMASFIGGLTAA